MTTIATKYPFVGSIETKQGGRDENQDNAGFVDTPLGLLLVVCDGMGGGPGGRTASLMAVDTMLTVLSDVSEHTHRKDALKFAIEKTNDIIYAKAKETPELIGMGTTVAALLINETSAVIAHAGDTRIYQLRKGAITYRSADHSVVANLVRQKKITEEEARNHPQSNVITRALGIRPNIEIEFDEVSFLRGDRFVLCTDGIWGMMSQYDLVKSLSRVMGIEELTILITEEIDKNGQKEGGGHDNLTLAILDTSFDSNKKTHKKWCLAKDSECNARILRNSYVKGVIWTALAFLILSVVLFIRYRNLIQRNGSVKSYQKEYNLGEINTPIVNIKPQIAQEDNSHEAPKIKPPAANRTKSEDVDNLFNDSAIIEHNKKIESHINQIVSDLDHLKKIRGKDRKGTRWEKQSFINSKIKPNINRLEKLVAAQKKNDVIRIIYMLNDNRATQSSKSGQPTKEGNEHIEQIKIKVKQLKY